MSIALVLGLLALAAAVVLGVYALTVDAPAAETVEFSPVLGASHPGAGTTTAVPAGRAKADPGELPALLDRSRAVARKLTPSNYAERLQRRLDLAGNPTAWPAARVLAFKGLGLVFGALSGLVLAAHGGITVILYPAIGGAVGFFLPDVLVKNMGQKRQIQLLKGLPDALDMMTVCVEAGLGFDAALARVARNLDGPMAEECARVLQEMQFGKSRTEALRALVDRTDVTELRTFVSSLIQAAELGISIGVVLREQAKEMRVRRRQRAEEAAHKLPVKILLPLVLCLLPAMFDIILGPALINIFHMLSNLNR